MRRTVSLLAVLVVLAVAGPAGATTLGSTGTSQPGGCGPDVIVWDTDPAFTVPAGGGVITSMATTSPEATGQMSFKVIRGTTVIATSPLVPVALGTTRVPMHVPVTGGEFIGLWTGDADCTVANSGGQNPGKQGTGDAPVGTTISGATTGTSVLAVEARLEPDADHDGFGDETEDSCPADASVHAGSCDADIGVTQSVVPSTIGVGDVAVATVTFANPSSGSAAGVTLGATFSPGLQLVSSFPAAGCAFTPALSCPLGSLAGGAGSVAALVVKGTRTGGQTITVGSSSANDPNATNNTATSTVTVEARQAIKCRVPKLKGLTKAFAKTLLKAVNCKLGKAKGRGRISKQAKKPGSVLPRGTKVNVTLKK